MSKGDWGDVNVWEALTAAGTAASVGMMRFLLLLRKGRKLKWFDYVLEPALAIFAGMLVWGLTELVSTPDLMQLVMSNLGAWGGPKTIQALEMKYLGPLTKE